MAGLVVGGQGEEVCENDEDMFDQVNLLSLPNEVLEYICCYVDMQSLCSLSQVCWRLNNIQESDVVWKAAFSKRLVILVHFHFYCITFWGHPGPNCSIPIMSWF